MHGTTPLPIGNHRSVRDRVQDTVDVGTQMTHGRLDHEGFVRMTHCGRAVYGLPDVPPSDPDASI